MSTLLFVLSMMLMLPPAFLRRSAEQPQARFRFGFGVLLFVASYVHVEHAAAAELRVPDSAAMYRRMVEQAVSDEWGIDGSSALLAAQLHQESTWRPKVRSRAGAIGMAQFMPATAQWIATQFPDKLGQFDPWDPAQAIRGAAVYDRHLYDSVTGASECDRWSFALSAYNGGLGWVKRDRNRASATGADPARWFGHVELAADPRRSAANIRQNRDYVRRILLVLQPLYLAAGWHGPEVCAL